MDRSVCPSSVRCSSRCLWQPCCRAPAHTPGITAGDGQALPVDTAALVCPIGADGNTGNARTTPPHLHWMTPGGPAVHPYPLASSLCRSTDG